MADESLDNRDPRSERSGQLPRGVESKQPDQPYNRRRIIIGSLLTPPAVMTLGARSARAQPTNSCMTSHTRNPNTSAHCM
jgi:hypothetical protein